MPPIFDKKYSDNINELKAKIRKEIENCIERNMKGKSDREKVLAHVLTTVKFANDMITDTLNALLLAEELAPEIAKQTSQKPIGEKIQIE